MSLAQEKLKRMQALASSAGVKEVAKAPSRRPPDKHRLNKMRQKSEESVVQELMRIVDMPVRYIPTEDDIDALSYHYFQTKAYNEGWRLYPSQAESLLAYSEVGGAFLPLAVGGGKTLTSLLIANDAFKEGKRKIMIITKSSLCGQLCDEDVKKWRPLTIFNTPMHRLAGLNKKRRKMLAQSGRNGIYVFSYELLSRDFEILDAVAPDLIIADEAHHVAKKSARAGRFKRYIHTNHPQLVTLSGTMAQKKLTDVHELVTASLGNGSFLPRSFALTEEWSKIVDTSATSMSDFDNESVPNAGPLKYMVKWARDNFPEDRFKEDNGIVTDLFGDSVTGFRHVVNKRMSTTPGVVTSSGHDLPYSLYIKNDPVENPESYAGWDTVQELVQNLEKEWETPNGDKIEEAMLIHRWRYWIEGVGFYNERYWPEVDWILKHTTAGSEGQARSILEKSQEYHAYHTSYQSDLRKWLNTRARTGLDTPMLLGKEMSIHGSDTVGQALYASWKMWKDSDFNGRIDRNKKAVRVCAFKIAKAVKWAGDLQGEGGIIWYDNIEVGEWTCDLLKEAGVEHVHCPGGSASAQFLLKMANFRGKVLVASIAAHGTGRNLQCDRNMFYLQWPRSATAAEQSIGRQHRSEQEYDEVYVTTCLTTPFDKVQYGATLNDAAYDHQTYGNQQKIIYATYSPKPEIVPFEVLQEWHIEDAKKLNAEGKDVLQKAFGQ